MKPLKLRLAAVLIVFVSGNSFGTLQTEVTTSSVSAGNLTKAQQQNLRQKAIDLYKELQEDLIEVQDSFVKILKDKIATLTAYSKRASSDLFHFFDEQVEGTADQTSGIVGFRVWVNEKREFVVDKYYAILKAIDPDYQYDSELSSYERNFIQGVQEITDESILLVQALILDLSSNAKQQKLSFDLQQGFFESALHAQKLYEEQLKKNQEKIEKNRSIWDDLREFGGNFCELFKEHAGAVIAQEVSKQISAMATGKSPKKGPMDDINSAILNKVDLLPNVLKNDSIQQLQDNKLSDVSMVLLRKAIRKKSPITPPAQAVVVKSNPNLCSQERQFLKNRKTKVQQVLKKEFDIDAPLRIAMCCSGGGNRAMVGTLGLFKAAAKHNILQATTYIVGLSGSTWTIGPWTYLYSKNFLGSKDYIKSLEALENNFVVTLNGDGMLDPLNKGAYTPPMLQTQSASVLSVQLMDRFGYEQNISLVDIWGALVGSYALNLSKTPFKLESCWSEIANVIVNGDLPMPLCSAAFDARIDVSTSAQKDVGSEYDWLETGPFEAGSTVLGYIPIQYFGSPFVNGNLINELVCPEYPMCFYLGVYGSAFSLTLNDLVEKGLKNPTIDVLGISVEVPVAAWVKTFLDQRTGSGATSKRYSKIHAQLSNFAKGTKMSLLQKNEIGLFDGGIAFNIPLPLVIDRHERAVDIVFMYDSNPGDFDTLKSADKYFTRKGIKLPSFSNGLRREDLTRSDFPMRVYNDPRVKKDYDKTQPTFIYFPTKVDVSNPPFATSNFRYTKDDIKDLTFVVQDNFEFHLDTIKDIMKKVAQARGGSLSNQVSALQPVKKEVLAQSVKPQVSVKKQVEKTTESNGLLLKKSNVKTSKNDDVKQSQGIDIEGLDGEEGKYFPADHTAYLVGNDATKIEYTDVKEYSQATTPWSKPWQAFATMPNVKYKPKDDKLAGGQFKMITLYGKLVK